MVRRTITINLQSRLCFELAFDLLMVDRGYYRLHGLSIKVDGD